MRVVIVVPYSLFQTSIHSVSSTLTSEDSTFDGRFELFLETTQVGAVYAVGHVQCTYGTLWNGTCGTLNLVLRTFFRNTTRYPQSFKPTQSKWVSKTRLFTSDDDTNADSNPVSNADSNISSLRSGQHATCHGRQWRTELVQTAGAKLKWLKGAGWGMVSMVAKRGCHSWSFLRG